MTARSSLQLRRSWYRPSLTMQIMIGLVVGGVIGWLRPDWGNTIYFLRDIFINLIKSIIAPLVFSTIVVGIAGAGGQTHPQSFIETVVHVFPASVIEAMMRGDVLQIVAFSVLFALAVSAVGEKAKPIIRAM